MLAADERSGTALASANSYSWPLWTVWNGQEGQQAVYFPSLFSNWMRPEHNGAPSVEPFALYSMRVHPNGSETQTMLFHLVRSESGKQGNSLTIGPILKMGNHTVNEPYVEILGGLLGFGYKEAGKRPGLHVAGFSIPGGKKKAAPVSAKSGQHLRRIEPEPRMIPLAMHP